MKNEKKENQDESEDNSDLPVFSDHQKALGASNKFSSTENGSDLSPLPLDIKGNENESPFSSSKNQ